eukprot:CAMPEP_0196592536 /NCGR_PEP_ID=MMETSP1081-20130531/73031_1 /TAXON_ID=36882 /ORGANISM="Pyramimonas amylifera, Strain CCMP720" /LENGTH=164 /DNA_ID=CAMNT_0041916261 /DNA_START=56 /DNA_END=550 /DNA_ORIENTATION=+
MFNGNGSSMGKSEHPLVKSPPKAAAHASRPPHTGTSNGSGGGRSSEGRRSVGGPFISAAKNSNSSSRSQNQSTSASSGSKSNDKDFKFQEELKPFSVALHNENLHRADSIHSAVTEVDSKAEISEKGDVDTPDLYKLSEDSSQQTATEDLFSSKGGSSVRSEEA